MLGPYTSLSSPGRTSSSHPHLDFLVVLLLDLGKAGVLNDNLVPPLFGLTHVDSVGEVL